jgi:hypothetical protein
LAHDLELLEGDVLERTAHDVNDPLEVHFDLAEQLQFTSELDEFLSDASFHSDHCRPDTFLDQFQSLDGTEDL